MTAAAGSGPRSRLGRGGLPGGTRFPGFDVTTQARHWDPVTAGVVLDRLRSPEPPRFFTAREEAIADALFDQLLAQREDPRVPVTAMVDSRLAEQRTDGWRYADMPEDGQAWRESLRLLDHDAAQRYGRGFCECPEDQQRELIQHVQDLGSDDWHHLPAGRVWSLWTRYGCTAFYSHPAAWNEIGFPGPAYPRGYKALGIGSLESFEVHDSRPQDDPAADGQA
ncbi:MAG TPA: gluconate 2-dehydrogenase subunit 3 family protein [Nakamurella sp.]|nr:gluconate 2-dehydrogenase subunit 3 family protein [Nakamurella sp.]